MLTRLAPAIALFTLAVPSAAAASYTTAVDAALVGPEIDLFPVLPQYMPPSEPSPLAGQTLDRVVLSLDGTLTATTTVSALPPSPLAALFLLEGTVRLFVFEDGMPGSSPSDEALLSFSGLERSTLELNPANLPITQTLNLEFPSSGAPLLIELDAMNPDQPSLFQGSSNLPLRLVIEAKSSLTANEPLDAATTVTFSGQVVVSYETQDFATPTPDTPIPDTPIPDTPVLKRPSSPTTIPEPSTVTGLLLLLGQTGWAFAGRRWKTAVQVR